MNPQIYFPLSPRGDSDWNFHFYQDSEKQLLFIEIKLVLFNSGVCRSAVMAFLCLFHYSIFRHV